MDGPHEASASKLNESSKSVQRIQSSDVKHIKKTAELSNSSFFEVG